MRISYIAIFMIMLSLTIFGQRSIAQDKPSEITPPSDGSPSVFEIAEKRYGGGMAQDGTWAVTTSLKVISYETIQDLRVKGSFEIESPGLAYHVSEKIIKGIFVLLIGERVFDEQGFYCYGHHVLSSGYLTDTGLPVEGISKGLPTDSFGGKLRHPINRYMVIPPEKIKVKQQEGILSGTFAMEGEVPQEIPSGWYRFSMLIGVQLDDNRAVTLRNEDPNMEELLGNNGSVFTLGIAPIQYPSMPHIPWILLPNDVAGGGVTSVADAKRFAVTSREGINRYAILPLTKSDGGQVSYRLEPSMPFLTNLKNSPIDLDIANGEIAVKIKTPKKNVIDLGKAKIKGWDGKYLSTGNSRFQFAFSEYGLHEIEVTGHVTDRNGLIIAGGGKYEIYIANPLSIVTTILPGMPLKSKDSIDLSMSVNPPVPAKIKVEKTLNPWSLNGKVEKTSFELSCNNWGIYTPKGEQVKKRWTQPEYLRFTRPGEYRVDILAEYRDNRGVLYMGTRTLAGVVIEDKLKIDIKGEDPSTRKTYPETDLVLTAPPSQGDMIVFDPESNMVFDPNLYVSFTSELRDLRILAAEKTLELPDGTIGILPRSTSEIYPAHWYPEKVDRRMYSQVAVSCTDGRTLFVTKDGGAMTDGSLNPSDLLKSAREGDVFHVYSSMILRDYPMDKIFYGTLAGGALPSKSVANPNVIPLVSNSLDVNGKKFPFMHSFNYYPGAVVSNETPFMPRCLVFPPQSGLITIALTEPNGSQRFMKAYVDERGVLDRVDGDTQAFWQEGVHSVIYAFYAGLNDGTLLDETKTPDHQVEFSFFVINDNPKNKFNWSLTSGFAIESGKPLSMNSIFPQDAYSQGTAYYVLSFNNEVIDHGEIPFEGNLFELNINLPQLIENIPNLDMRDPYDAIQLGCIVKGVDPSGKAKFMANRTVIRDGRIEY